jgi:hypothetical protein
LVNAELGSNSLCWDLVMIEVAGAALAKIHAQLDQAG